MREGIKIDPNRAILGLAQYGDICEEAVRAAYWRLIRKVFRQAGDVGFAQLQDAKRALLLEVGVRIPKRKSAK